MTRTERELLLRNISIFKRTRAEGIVDSRGRYYCREEDIQLLEASGIAVKQLHSLKHTTKGDFCHLHSGRNEVKA